MEAKTPDEARRIAAWAESIKISREMLSEAGIKWRGWYIED